MLDFQALSTRRGCFAPNEGKKKKKKEKERNEGRIPRDVFLSRDPNAETWMSRGAGEGGREDK